MGHRVRPRSRQPWISGARDIERCRRLFDWTPARRFDAGRGADARAHDCRRDRSALSADLERGFGERRSRWLRRFGSRLTRELWAAPSRTRPGAPNARFTTNLSRWTELRRLLRRRATR